MESKVIWYKIEDGNFPANKWLLIVTSDNAQHIAYFDARHKKWEANSKFGAEPVWWSEQPATPYDK